MGRSTGETIGEGVASHYWLQTIKEYHNMGIRKIYQVFLMQFLKQKMGIREDTDERYSQWENVSLFKPEKPFKPADQAVCTGALKE